MTFDGTVAPGLFESGGESGLVTAQMFGEVSEWGGGGSEAHAVAALAGGLSQSQGKVRFPCAAVAQQQHRSSFTRWRDTRDTIFDPKWVLEGCVQVTKVNQCNLINIFNLREGGIHISS